MAARKPIVINTSGQGQQELPSTDWTAGDVSYAVAQGLTAAQQGQARSNAGAAASGANTDITSLSAPALGAATAPTPATADASTRVATTAMVQAAVQQATGFAYVAGIVF